LVIAIVQISLLSARQQTAWGMSGIEGDINGRIPQTDPEASLGSGQDWA
jgi:hypothetical protein